MGLFSSKKKVQLASDNEEDMASRPVMPDFPDIPDNMDQEEEVGYEPSIADIKNEVSRDDDNFDIPERKPMIRPKLAPKMDEIFSDRIPSFDDEKPLFIKIDQYKDALKHLELLKSKIDDAEGLLKELDSVREEEEKKIEQWKADLNSVKEKLLAIDKSLFEV